LWCEVTIDVEFCLAGGLALIQRRIIEKRIAHRALDLDDTVAGEKNHGAMSVEAPDFRAAISRRIVEELENGILIAGGVLGRL